MPLREEGFGNKKTAHLDDILDPGILLSWGGEQGGYLPMVCIDFYDGNRGVINSLAPEASCIFLSVVLRRKDQVRAIGI